MIDFAKLEKDAIESLKTDLLFVALLGGSGQGKSRACGSLPGKILYIHTSGESHGPISAAAGGNTVFPIQIDVDTKRALSADETYVRLLEILKSREQLEKLGIKSVVLDGATELEQVIRGTKAFKEKCKTSSGGHNAFNEGAATIDLMRPVLDELRNLQRDLKVHIVVTCLLDVKNVGDKKEVLEASPKLTSYGVASSVIPQFGDVLMIGRMQEDEGEVQYNFQMGGNVSKVSKEVNGRVKKMINFSPRISVLNHGVEIPEYIPADFAEILKIKQMVVKK
jgi:hypothetical protein